MKHWTRPFVHNNRFYEAMFLKRPLRSRLEGTVDVKGKTVHASDVEMEEQALIEKLKGEIDKLLMAGHA